MNQQCPLTRSGRSPAARPLRRWYWQTVLAVLLAVLAVEGQPVAASPASGPGASVRTTRFARSVAPPPLPVHQSPAVATERPDLRLTSESVGTVTASQPFRWTLQMQNLGAAADAVSVSALAPPAVSNVRVTAPGFVCTRHFTASGPSAGTVVTCSRSDFEGGASAEVTIEANAPANPGVYQFSATADPRDDVQEADEANNSAALTVEVRG